MDPIRIPESPDPQPVGTSLFIPFEGFNARVENGQGKADFKIATDLPPQKTIHDAKTYIANNRALATRIIEYREYSAKEIVKNPKLMQYLSMHRGAL